MNRWLLAAALLLGCAGFATADYIILVANVGSEKEEQQLNTVPGGAPGVPGGAAGAAGMPAPGRGMPAGGPGMPAGGPGMGGMRGGMRGGPRGMGGMMGMPAMPAVPGGEFGTMGAADIDDVPYFIITVVEVDTGRKGDITKQFQKGLKGGALLAQVKLTDRLGEEYANAKWPIYLLPKTSFGEVHILTENDGKAVPTVRQQFTKKFENIKEKASASDILRLAEWTLSHGLIDKFPQVMDKLVETQKDDRAAVAYLKVKGDLEKKAAPNDSVAQIQKALNGYKPSPDAASPHYTILYNSSITATEVKSYLDQLENSLRGFYYWFVLKGVALPAPAHRQVVVLTSAEKDFDQFHESLEAGPVVVDGFFARHEKLAVMSSKRQDESYDALSKYYETWEGKGFHRADVLLQKPKATQLQMNGGQTFAEAQMLSLMLRALEKEAELATVSHDASRQLLFASGLLPNNVAAPEWLLFGMGSFFETPLQSPWPSLGAPSSYYLPRWQELKGKGFEKKAGQTLRKVITDVYFRGLPPEGKSGSEERHAHDDAVRKARTAAWSLTYFLATSRHFDGLQRYFKELSKMPRDIELDDEVLLGCFARAFSLVDANNKLDVTKLDHALESLEREWYSYMDNLHFDSETIVKKIRQTFRDKLKEMEEASANAKNNQQDQIDPRTGQPMQPGIYGPGGPRGRLPQQGSSGFGPQGPGRGRVNPQQQPPGMAPIPRGNNTRPPRR